MNGFFNGGLLIISGIVLPPLLTAIASLFGKHQSRRQSVLTFIASVFSFGFSVALVFYILSEPSHSFHFLFLFYIDALSTYFILLVNIVALFASYFTIFMPRQDDETQAEQDKALGSSRFDIM